MASRQTRVLGGNGTATQTFRLDPGLLQYVQSVYVTVDNSAGGVINPTLTIATNNGTALAKQRQGRPIPAGDSGSATWALRLADEQPAPADQRAYARFVGSELAASATKVLVPAAVGTIIIPLDWYIVASTDYEPSGGQPDLELRSSAFVWDGHNVDSFGVTFYNNASGYFLAPGVDTIPLLLSGRPLQVTAVSNGATSAVGHIEVFVRYYTVAVSP